MKVVEDNGQEICTDYFIGLLFYSGVSISGSPGGLFLFIAQMESGLNEKGSIDNYF